MSKETNKTMANLCNTPLESSIDEFFVAASYLRVLCTLHTTVKSSFCKDEKDTRKIIRVNDINKVYDISTGTATGRTKLKRGSEVCHLKAADFRRHSGANTVVLTTPVTTATSKLPRLVIQQQLA